MTLDPVFWRRVYPPAETKPAPSTNAHGVDVSRIAVGDYVRLDRGWGWMLVAEATEQSVGCRNGRAHRASGKSEVVEHRAAPRIVLPDGREVVPERLSRDHGGLYANIDGDAWIKSTHQAAWSLHDPGDPWTDAENSTAEERLWPPADVEPA